MMDQVVKLSASSHRALKQLEIVNLGDRLTHLFSLLGTLVSWTRVFPYNPELPPPSP